MDVIGLAGKSDTELAKVFLERFGNLSRLLVSYGHIFASSFDPGTDRSQIKVRKAPLPEHDLPVNHDIIDGAAIFRVS